MGLATILNMTAFVCIPAWGPWVITFVWTLWWIDVVISIACCMYMPFVIMHIHKHSSLATMTAVWLLPIVSTIVASASGGIVASYLPNPQHALWTLIISYILWGTGVPLAMVVLVIYFQRLTIHYLPPREVIVSVFLPLGPLGQGGFAIMQLGKVAMDVMPKTQSLIPEAGKILYVAGFGLALVMWGYGLVWLFFALASISRSRFPFNMGWWGFTFPLGVFTVSTVQISHELPSRFFRVLGMIFSMAVICLWLLVSVRTVEASIRGKMFFAPCVAEYQQGRVRKEVEETEKRRHSSVAASQEAV